MITLREDDLREDRFSRLRLIPWWDQTKVSACRVLVVGAGALGNEILKNLLLLGFRKIVILDLDRIEESNLSRTILFRRRDIGKFKVHAAAEACREIEPDCEVTPLVGNVMEDCGLGVFEWSDLILAGLDNREARLWINRAAWKVGRPWIDGAIEGINGVARVFLPGQAPCYECTLGEVDWAILERRMSCNLLMHDPAPEGKVPTTPTISSIIAGIQVQEAMKLIHGLPVLASRGFVFEGMNHSSYAVTYTENPDCMSHYTIPSLIRLPGRSGDWTLEALRRRAQMDLQAEEVVLEFSRDIVQRLACATCGKVEDLYVPASRLRYGQAKCPDDGQMRVVRTIHAYNGTESYGGRTLDQLGLPLFDVLVARSVVPGGEGREIGYLPEGDGRDVLGPLASGGER